MLMTYFLDDDFDEALLSLAADQCSKEYYANMMTAWTFADEQKSYLKSLKIK